jgi:hypothetical protein
MSPLKRKENIMKKLKRIFAISILVGILYGYCCLIMATYNNVEEYKYKRLYNMTKDYILAIESTEEIVEDIEIESEVIVEEELIEISSEILLAQREEEIEVATQPIEIVHIECDEYTEYEIPQHRDFKSYMSYKALINHSSPQWKLQSEHAYTGEYGIRQVNERYCIAVGSHFGCRIGQYIDLVLENGVIIPCIMGDGKADQHTDVTNIFSANGCCSEFIVDMSCFSGAAKNSGSTSSVCEEWKSPVKYIRVYKVNVFEY